MPSADSSFASVLARLPGRSNRHPVPAANACIALQLAPRRATLALAAVALLLLGAHLLALAVDQAPDLEHASGWVKLVHLDGERNLPALFATALLLLDALLFALWARGAIGDARAARMWQLLAALFCLLAFDEFFSLHERLVEPLRAALGTGGALHYAWVLPYGLAVLLLAAAFLPVFLRLPWAQQWRLALAAALYLGGALGMEMVGGALIAAGQAPTATPYLLATTLEECLELAGLIALADALLAGLGTVPGGLVLRIGARAAVDAQR